MHLEHKCQHLGVDTQVRACQLLCLLYRSANPAIVERYARIIFVNVSPAALTHCSTKLKFARMQAEVCAASACVLANSSLVLQCVKAAVEFSQTDLAAFVKLSWQLCRPFEMCIAAKCVPIDSC